MQLMRFSQHDNDHRPVISFPHFLSDVAFYLCQAVYVLTSPFNITWTTDGSQLILVCDVAALSHTC